MIKQHKELALAALFVASGWAFWATLRLYLRVTPTYDARLIVPFITLFIFAVLYALVVALIENQRRWTVSWLAVCAGGFAIAPGILTLVVVLLLFIGGMYARSCARQSLMYSIGKKYYIPLRKAFPIMFTMLAVVIAFLFLALQPNLPQSSSSILPKRLFFQVLRGTDDLIARQMPNFSADVRFDEYVLKLTEQQTGIDTSALSRANKQLLIKTQAAQLGKQLGIAIDPSRTLGEILYAGSIAKLDAAAAKYLNYFPYIAAIGLFLVLKALFAILRIAVLLAVLLIIKILLALNIIHLETIEQKVQYPVL